jgi:hypothetical protein
MGKMRKPSGWKLHGVHWYVNERRKHGCCYKCAYCGWEVLGLDLRMKSHALTCKKRKAAMEYDRHARGEA